MAMNPKLAALTAMQDTKPATTAPEGADEDKKFEDAVTELKDLGLPAKLEKEIRDWYAADESNESPEEDKSESGPEAGSSQYGY